MYNSQEINKLNETTRAFKSIVSKNDKYSIFHVGPNNHCEDSNRIYLDNIAFKDQARNIDSIKSVISKVTKEILGKDFFVCFVDNNYENKSQVSELEKGDFEQLVNCKIEIPREHYFETNYIDEEEWFTSFIFYKELRLNSMEYFEFILNRFLGIPNKPFLPFDTFLIDKNLEWLVNLYDDRGIDIVKLKK